MDKQVTPNFTNCIRDENGELWCYDEIEKLVCRVIPVAPTAIPQKVLYDLLQAESKRGKYDT